MKLVLSFVALLVAVQAHEIFIPRRGIPPPDPPKARAATPKWGQITQKLDNFDADERRTWTMRYISNDQFFKPGGPIFIMVGAEWTIDPGWLQTGQMFDMADKHNAYMFYTEHRYYGKSIPTSDLSPANLKYLTTPQALADVAHFIEEMKQTIPDLANSKVIIFGGSYGGNMAIWLREKYPNLVHASHSSSAPVKAEADFKEYYEVVQRSLADPKCYGIIARGVAKIKEYLGVGVSGINKVTSDFKLCTPVDVDDFYDKAYFYNNIAGTFAGLIQYASSDTVRDVCNELMTNAGPTDYDRLVSFVASRRQTCYSNYQYFVDYFSRWDTNTGDSRQWMYQTCNEYGYFQTSASPNQPFGDEFPVEMNYKMCTDLYGPTFDANHVNTGVKNTNKNYGALNPPVTRVVSVHGFVDPWSSLGLSQDLNPSAPVIVIPGASHCADLRSISLFDDAAMRDAKLRVQQLISAWLQEP